LVCVFTKSSTLTGKEVISGGALAIGHFGLA
jgi:hypothetical protein